MNRFSEKILRKFNIPSLDELAETLPSALSTGVHILKAEEYYSQEKEWEAFHHLSLTHSTLMYHRIYHKLYRPKRNIGCTKSSTNNSYSKDNGIKFPDELSNDISVLRPSTANETKMLFAYLPSDWTVIQITSEGRQSGKEMTWKRIDEPSYIPSMYISRCTGGSTPTLIIQKVEPPIGQKNIRTILQEMELIKAENKVINNYWQNDHDKYLVKKEEINNRLRVLVQSMESSWLRLYACMLVGSLPPSQQAHLEKVIGEAVKRSNICVSTNQLALLTLLVSCPPPPSGNPLVRFSFKASVALILGESVRAPSVKTLSSYLKEAQKEIEELVHFPRNPVILILDKCFVSLPWEMMRGLQGQPVTRMPSLHSLLHLYLHHSQKSTSLLAKGIDATRGFFIVDPDNNLPRTQDRLQETFSLTRWDGIRGRKPCPDQFMEALSTKDIFVYVGHGSGSQYMPAQLETVDCHSLALLYGCSSASLARRGAVADPWGVVLNYLLSSCPCVVGMLWEVMDKDTDLLTKEMVKALTGQNMSSGSPLENPPSDLAHLVAKARPLCSWYLISAALVVYGLPLHVALPSTAGCEKVRES